MSLINSSVVSCFLCLATSTLPPKANKSSLHMPVAVRFVNKITAGPFVANLLSANIHGSEQEPKIFLEGKLLSQFCSWSSDWYTCTTGQI